MRVISIVIILLSTLACHPEAGISRISEDLIDLFAASEDPDNYMDAIVLTATKSKGESVLYMALMNINEIKSYSDNTDLEEWHAFQTYKDRKIFVYGNGSIWWKGEKRHKDIIHQMNQEVNWDWSIWEIVLHPDNTLNTYLTNKGRCANEDDIIDIEQVFQKHSLLKNDSDWADGHIFTFDEIRYLNQPVFIETNNFVQYLKKNPVMGEDSVKNVCPVEVKVLINTDGSLQYQGISFGVGGVVPKMSREQKKGFKDLGMAICSEFKVVPVEYRGHRIRYESEIPVWPIREVLSYCIYQQSL